MTSMFGDKLRKNYNHLRKWAQREKHSAFRLFDRDIPEYPVAIDWYDGSVVASVYDSPHIEDQHQNVELFKEKINTDLIEVLQIDKQNIFYKERRRKEGKDQYERLAQNGVCKTVMENRLIFKVNLSDFLDTGLFLDHRNTRKLVGTMAKGKRVLNLFAYTGTVSVYAASGGAEQVTTVDLSNTYLAWAQENFAINHLPCTTSTFVRADCLQFLEDTNPSENLFDLIFVDPPTFSNSKKMRDTFDVQRDHVYLLRKCLRLLAPQGLIFFTNNLRTFTFDQAAFPDCELKDITARTIPPDYRNQRIHCAWLISKK